MPTAGAGERGKRSAHSSSRCRKQNGDLLLLLWGYLRGYPLDALLVTFLAREKSPVGDRNTVAIRLCLTAAQRHRQSPSQPTADSPLCTRGPFGCATKQNDKLRFAVGSTDISRCNKKCLQVFTCRHLINETTKG